MTEAEKKAAAKKKKPPKKPLPWYLSWGPMKTLSEQRKQVDKNIEAAKK